LKRYALGERIAGDKRLDNPRLREKEWSNMSANEDFANRVDDHAETGPPTVKCPKCGAVNLQEATNCRGCGVNLEWAMEHPQEEWRDQAAAMPPAPALDEHIEDEIKKLARGALINAIVGIFLFGIILGPLALWRANKAIRLIQEHGIGQEHEGRAKAAQVIAVIALCLWALLVILQLGQG
jgi:hypothetical protein